MAVGFRMTREQGLNVTARKRPPKDRAAACC
jgi:hypothetical protein